MSPTSAGGGMSCWGYNMPLDIPYEKMMIISDWLNFSAMVCHRLFLFYQTPPYPLYLLSYY